jgi:hypothetical protein
VSCFKTQVLSVLSDSGAGETAVCFLEDCYPSYLMYSTTVVHKPNYGILYANNYRLLWLKRGHYQFHVICIKHEGIRVRREGSVIVESRLRAGRPKNRGSVAWGTEVFPLHIQTGCRGRVVSCPVAFRYTFQVIRV